MLIYFVFDPYSFGKVLILLPVMFNTNTFWHVHLFHCKYMSLWMLCTLQPFILTVWNHLFKIVLMICTKFEKLPSKFAEKIFFRSSRALHSIAFLGEYMIACYFWWQNKFMFVLAFVQSAAPESFPSKSCERPSFPEKRHPTITETHFLRLKLFPVMYIYTSTHHHSAWSVIVKSLCLDFRTAGCEL